MKPVEQWTLKECVDMCRVSDCEDCLLEELCGKGVDRWELPMRFTKKELDALGSFSKIGINYLARDKEGVLYWYRDKPVKRTSSWATTGKSGSLPADRFLLVQWEDEEPLDIRAELKR